MSSYNPISSIKAYIVRSLLALLDIVAFTRMTSLTSARTSGAGKRERHLKPCYCALAEIKSSFCRKTTMTKHVRKEHPAEPVQEDQDAEYSDVDASDDEVEDESDEIKEEPQSLYQDTKHMQLGRTPSEYSRNLWPLPGQTAHRPLHPQSSNIPHSDASAQEIRLERISSATPQRSSTDPYPDGSMQTPEYSLSRSDTIPANIAIPTSVPQSLRSDPMSQQYLLRNHDNAGLWSPQHGIQESPTSLSQSSPRSASSQSHPLFTSQPYQVSSYEQMQYPPHHEVLVQSTIWQTLDDLTVHEIHLDQPRPQTHCEMAPTPVHQNPFASSIPQHVPHTVMSREVSQYQDDLPPALASTLQLSHHTPSPAAYQERHFLPLDPFSSNTQAYPALGGFYQYNEAATSWWTVEKVEANGFLLPAQRVLEESYGSWGA